MKPLNQLLIAELQREAASTRKILAVVPTDKLEWRPHEKSMTLGRLASHVAEIPHWLNRPLENDVFDMAAQPYKPANCQNTQELLDLFETKLSAAIAALEKATDEDLAKQWTFRRGEHIVFQLSSYEAIRYMMGNHQVHHRGQLSVFLRLLDVPIPGMYGPSADDVAAMAATAKN
ncbi:DinB family protein [Polluticoccus soli]|uniref:DinB family protein n=1 Tax=Polluticoccus soli TaxID=3034150 RepID=UPI0023E18E28|nr:DinB family protein [Flavipsychrobacter sp. JY13-12]